MNKFRVFSTLFLSWIMFFANIGFVAAAEKEEKPPEWILSYAFTGMCIGLGLLLIVRSSKRQPSIISEYEHKRMQEEELKKSTGH